MSAAETSLAMEWENNLRRTQSLRSITSSCDQPTWTGAGLRGKTTSVSQLVARYQTTVEVNTSIEETMMTPSLSESPEIRLEVLIMRNEEKERSRAKAGLVRSKSVGSLQSSTVSIEALKAVFESKAQNNTKSSFRASSSTSPYKSADFMPVMNGKAEEVERHAQKVKTQIPAEAPVDDAKEDRETKKVVHQAPTERRKTIGGIDFEKIAASQDEDKRRSIADFRDIKSKEKLSVSVKAISALFLSKAAPQDPTNGLLKTAQHQSSETGKRAKLSKFQPACQEMCSACLKPVYPMEKITADKYIFHKTCFCCKQCKKKLSMYNYTPLHGEFYCIFHYQQLFRRKGNYDEGFGHVQHKNRWLLRNTADNISNESDA
ncbi:uncharacterized protein AB9X84_026058 isoform 1-T3 [Acanthopagrus schlegelii]